MAFHPDPPGDLMSTSSSVKQTTLLDTKGNEIGLDSKGIKSDQSHWRWFGVLSEGGEYKNAPPEDAALFDRILESACLSPYPSH